MNVFKKSDGIRKKIEPRATRDEIMRKEPQERASLRESAAPMRAPRMPPPDDIKLIPKSQFLDHWRIFQKSRDHEFQKEDDGIDAMDRAADDGEKNSRAGRQRWPVSARSRLVRWGMVVGGGAVAALIIFVSTWGASLTIGFKARIDEMALQDIGVAFDTSAAKILVPQKVVPAEALSFLKKKVQSFPATGRQQIAERSRGKAAIVNSFSSSPQTLITGTRFLTDAGILFRLPKSVTVPGAKIEEGKIVPQSVETDLVADAPGERSNMAGAVNLKIPGFKGTPKYDGFFATVAQGFAGGFQGEATVVSADNLKTGQEQVTKSLFDDLKAEINRKIPSGFTALKELQNIEITKVTAPAVGTRAEQFSVSADAVAKVMIFRQEDAEALVKAFALADASDQELVPGSAQLQYHSRSIDFDKGMADMTIAGSIKTKAMVHRDELAVLVAGKKGAAIADVLHSRPELASFTISFFPLWRSSAPSDPSRIHFKAE